MQIELPFDAGFDETLDEMLRLAGQLSRTHSESSEPSVDWSGAASSNASRLRLSASVRKIIKI